MIRYALKCARGHRFESWFQSASAYDRLADAGHVACSVCGGGEVAKDLMSPSVSPEARTPARPLSQPTNPAEQALAELRRKIETDSTYVGDRFADEARRMHEGELPRRQIHGEARLGEAKKLLEDGIPVLPLPFLSRRSTQ
ncbi:DUF1178 family protein [Histidinibacterium lentulum]|uniref:DUF1178 family protein n=1 Tax=Histidinibacterium lentulum TaxID=2480588 RepID=A0A3N2QV11_9RHOB|nr:DUF1178 family protein [Histidinibacterium lentulum]ROT99063.1 DUF1178 family protein [Histidinibacterium lentulum]